MNTPTMTRAHLYAQAKHKPGCFCNYCEGNYLLVSALVAGDAVVVPLDEWDALCKAYFAGYANTMSRWRSLASPVAQEEK